MQFALDVAAEEEISEIPSVPMDTASNNETSSQSEHNISSVKVTSTSETQTPEWADFSLSKFRYDRESIMNYTGLEEFKKVNFVLQTLGDAPYHLNYFYAQVHQISVFHGINQTEAKEDQF